uniref:Cytosine-specific methyltransferase n=1 Tax=Arcella intermedia TaxID=1963864 RepID=A0A6B2L6I6_9EUKA
MGLEAIGGKIAFVSEIDKKAQSTYCANFKEDGCVLCGDITEIDSSFIPRHDILTAGFPCQSFSKAGPAKGFSDPRGTLFREITRVLRDCKPKALILENVSALVTHENGATFDIILSEIVSAGYIVNYRILNTSWVTPQHRERVYIIGFRSDLSETVLSSFEWPVFPIIPVTVKDILEDSRVGISEDEDKYGLTEKQWETIQKMETDVNKRMVKLDGKARTLMSHYKKSCYLYSEFVPRDNGLRPRFYTPRECARLQGFPEDFILTSCGPDPNRIYYQLGNTVCPIIISALAVKVLKVLETHQGNPPNVTPDTKGMDAVMSLLLSSSPNPQASLPNGQSLQQIANLFLSSDPSINTTNGQGPIEWRSNKSQV